MHWDELVKSYEYREEEILPIASISEVSNQADSKGTEHLHPVELGWSRVTQQCLSHSVLQQQVIKTNVIALDRYPASVIDVGIHEGPVWARAEWTVEWVNYDHFYHNYIE